MTHNAACQILKQLEEAKMLTTEKTLNQKIAILEKSVTSIMQTLKQHEQGRIDFMENTIDFVKKSEINLVAPLDTKK
jgi:chromosome condensin MukBEF ATPase and DNA-binding subunit MukB